MAQMHSYVHHPSWTDIEAYTDAIPAMPLTLSMLSAYSNACWGSQIGNAFAEGALLPLFKFQSMNSGIIFHNGGPVGWLEKHQICTFLSSGEAKICTTNVTSKKVADFRNLCCSASKLVTPCLTLICLRFSTTTTMPV
jgi:hypothetical protein